MSYDFVEMMLSAVTTAVQSGREILRIYEKPFEVERKEDHSPVTVADRASHRVIEKLLQISFPEIPVLSEEGKTVPFKVRKKWSLFWLVDPLDGTKDFIKRNGEFTVNIALVRGNTPVLGVINIPSADTVYFGMEGGGAFKVTAASKYIYKKKNSDIIFDRSETLPIDREKKREHLVIVKSRSHSGEKTEQCIEKLLALYSGNRIITAGSSIKLCLLAEGSADVYPRLGPTMEWDTAAGHAVLRFSGGDVLRADNWSPLVYNKEELLNPPFVAVKNGAEKLKKTVQSLCKEGV
jgi:3'(2'), 5'-bisphosphate nucleotidase